MKNELRRIVEKSQTLNSEQVRISNGIVFYETLYDEVIMREKLEGKVPQISDGWCDWDGNSVSKTRENMHVILYVTKFQDGALLIEMPNWGKI